MSYISLQQANSETKEPQVTSPSPTAIGKIIYDIFPEKKLVEQFTTSFLCGKPERNKAICCDVSQENGIQEFSKHVFFVIYIREK